MAVAKDKSLSVIKEKNRARKANEGRGHASRQEGSILPPLLRTWVMSVATGATCRRVGAAEIIFH